MSCHKFAHTTTNAVVIVTINISSASHSNMKMRSVCQVSENRISHSSRLYLFAIVSLCSQAIASTVNHIVATGIENVRAFACTSRLNSLNLILNVLHNGQKPQTLCHIFFLVDSFSLSLSSFPIVFCFASFAFPLSRHTMQTLAGSVRFFFLSRCCGSQSVRQHTIRIGQNANFHILLSVSNVAQNRHMCFSWFTYLCTSFAWSHRCAPKNCVSFRRFRRTPLAYIRWIQYIQIHTQHEQCENNSVASIWERVDPLYVLDVQV